MPTMRWCGVLLLAAGCGSAAAPPAARPRPPALADVARDGFEAELRELGFRVAPGAGTITASRDAHDWSFSLGLESHPTADGQKLQVRLSVFSGPNRSLRGEIAPWAIPVGSAPDGSLARDLGRRAAKQFDESFAR